MRFILPLLLALAVAGLVACDTAEVDPDPDPQPIAADTLADVPADPATGRDPETGQAISLNRFAFVSLREGAVVLASDDENRADSNSTAWDLAFRGTEIIANGGENGPGEGGVQLVTGTFDEVSEAPEAGYADAPAEDWYHYAGPPTHLITPVPGRVLVVRTADGRYAKVRILSYYRGAPAEPDAFEDEERYYTFEYVFQPDGSRQFTTTE